ncbi:MAG: DNA polymerase III subunit delta [Ruminococcaceae bacterium]|nr:DNA polymerase III subunit delta [Oscillospiraceae bacterium]
MEIKDLDKQISSGNLGKLYFFYGDEQFLMEHKIKSIKNKLIAKDFADFNFVRLDGKKTTAADIRREVMAVPAMSDMRMVVVQNTGIFGNAKLRDFKEVCELLEDIPEYLCLIFTERDFDKKKEKNLDLFKKHGEVVKFDLLSPVQLERWLEKLFESKGKSVLSTDLQTMIDLCGQNMSNLFNEYQKLLSFLGERTKLTEDDIRAVVSKSTATRIFEVIDSIALGKAKGVFDELSAMRAAGENPSTIMSLITTRLSELLMVKQLGFDKLSRDKIAEYFEPRKPSFVVGKLIDQSKGFSEEYLIKMTLKGPEYTAAVRSGLLDKWVAVEMYASELLKK